MKPKKTLGFKVLEILKLGFESDAKFESAILFWGRVLKP